MDHNIMEFVEVCGACGRSWLPKSWIKTVKAPCGMTLCHYCDIRGNHFCDLCKAKNNEEEAIHEERE